MSRNEARSASLLARGLVATIRGYQYAISSWRPRTCRYYPTCSGYAVTALQRHGAARGLLLAGWRLLRCNPWTKGGVDHVPDAAAPMPWSRRRRRGRTLQSEACGTQREVASDNFEETNR